MHLRNCLQRKDLLQLMIDATDSETQKGLEGGEIVADSVGFMLAGYETTSTALTFATYLLAANPEAQERLANEIHEYFDENPVSDRGFLALYMHCATVSYSLDCAFPAQDKSMYDATRELQYLDMVFEETLRMYPPAPVYVGCSCLTSTVGVV